jgi:hypothetical protein
MRTRRNLGLIATGALMLGVMSYAAPNASAGRFGYADLKPAQKGHVSGMLLEPRQQAAATRRALPGGHRTSAPGCDRRRGNNVKVNQDCASASDADLHGRGQAQNETWVSVNPGNPRQLLVGYNDYRRADGTCGLSYSLDGGRRWADATMPNGFVRGTAFGGTPREYFQASGDPGIDWDSRGNAYYACLMFKRGAAVSPDEDASNGIYVFRSTGTAGRSWNFTARPVVEHNDVAGAGNHLEDKPFMAVDRFRTSRFRDRVYVTWTRFAADGTAYIFASTSADYGETFSAPVLVSADSALCTEALGLPTPRGRCNTNQFSHPVVAADGTLYVAFANYNSLGTGNDNRFQMLLARSTNGGASFEAPVKVGDFHELPDCDTYQGAGKNPFRSCVVEKGTSTNSIFRAANYPMAAVDPRNPRRVVVTYASYINRNSNESRGCTPAGVTPALTGLYTGVKNGGCNNDILISTSTDGGRTFTGSTTNVRNMPVVSDARGQRTTDQYFQGAVFSPTGNLVVVYYDRQYGNDQFTGYSDVTLTTSRGFAHRRVTSSSMPPATQFNGQFFGDYIMVAASARTAHPVWVDTRDVAPFPCAGTGSPALCTAAAPGLQTVNPANEQNIYTAAVPIR